MRTRTKFLWISLLYFAQGLPFGIFNDCIPVYLRTHGVGLAQIGFFSLLGLPWSIKFFWSPLVDRFGKFSTWIACALLALAATLFLLPGLDPAHPAGLFWILLLGLTIASATQDVAIDAYSIGLLDPPEIGTANGIRVTAYRIALILGGGGIVALAETVAWGTLFRLAGTLMILLAGMSLLTPQAPRRPEERRRIVRPLLDWLRRPAAPLVLLFVLLYKLGDAAMAPMVKPFWVDRGMSLLEIGTVSTTLGVVATVAGALLGGWFASRVGILRALWILGLFQAVSNLVYAGVAFLGLSRGGIYFASLFESFSAGLGTAAFLAFLMSICQKEHAATQYALLSALFGLTRSVAGGFSGWGTEHLGYGSYFALTFLLALPAYLLLPWVARYLRALPAAERRGGSPVSLS
jgi:MFS transporter, PAT family, beta-lactamase induction signal transducer AmpG